MIEDDFITYAQPDVSKAGGVTELLRIANLMSGWNISINPHTSLTAINMAVSIHILASIENGGYFEGDVTNYNPFRDDMSVDPFKLDKNGFVEPLDIPGTGVDIDPPKGEPRTSTVVSGIGIIEAVPTGTIAEAVTVKLL